MFLVTQYLNSLLSLLRTEILIQQMLLEIWVGAMDTNMQTLHELLTIYLQICDN